MERKIWTAAELEKMTPAQRSEISRAAEVSDPNEFPELLNVPASLCWTGSRLKKAPQLLERTSRRSR